MSYVVSDENFWVSAERCKLNNFWGICGLFMMITLEGIQHLLE